ncbi:MAG: hypothetical protein RBS34_16390 [Desulfofustis sp.]|jgi:hypothetical protein|nr:hypothetical protein [Desulfofustis sp.]
MSYHPQHFREVVRETLTLGGWYSPAAEENLFAIAAHESHLGTYLRQHPTGPARGAFGMEIGTDRLLWSWLAESRRANLRAAVTVITGLRGPSPWALLMRLDYQIVMARILLLSYPEPLPPADDITLIADHWKRRWNTVHGKGTVAKFIADYRRFNR